MTLKDAVDNILVDLNSYQIIHIVTSKVKDNKSITYSIGVAMINDKYIFRVEADEYVAVQTYQLDTTEKAKNKLTWLIKKYSLTIESIIYINYWHCVLRIMCSLIHLKRKGLHEMKC